MQANLRALAVTDIEAAVTYYRDEAGTAIEHDFVDALQTEITHLLRHPLTGPLRFAFELEIPNLRSWLSTSSPT